MTEYDNFAELRGVLSAVSSEDGWESLVEHLMHVPDEQMELVLGYVKQHVDSLPGAASPKACVLPYEFVRSFDVPFATGVRLVDEDIPALDLATFPDVRYIDLRMAPGLFGRQFREYCEAFLPAWLEPWASGTAFWNGRELVLFVEGATKATRVIAFPESVQASGFDGEHLSLVFLDGESVTFHRNRVSWCTFSPMVNAATSADGDVVAGADQGTDGHPGMVYLVSGATNSFVDEPDWFLGSAGVGCSPDGSHAAYSYWTSQPYSEWGSYGNRMQGTMVVNVATGEQVYHEFDYREFDEFPRFQLHCSNRGIPVVETGIEEEGVQESLVSWSEEEGYFFPSGQGSVGHVSFDDSDQNVGIVFLSGEACVLRRMDGKAIVHFLEEELGSVVLGLKVGSDLLHWVDSLYQIHEVPYCELEGREAESW